MNDLELRLANITGMVKEKNQNRAKLIESTIEPTSSEPEEIYLGVLGE
ncbi:hypothetical protein [Xenorhabdus sp. TH1]